MDAGFATQTHVPVPTDTTARDTPNVPRASCSARQVRLSTMQKCELNYGTKVNKLRSTYTSKANLTRGC